MSEDYEGVVVVARSDDIHLAYEALEGFGILLDDGFEVRSGRGAGVSDVESAAFGAALSVDVREEHLPIAVRRRFGEYRVFAASRESAVRHLVDDSEADPVEAYEKLRASGDVVWDEGTSSWYVLSAALARRCLGDPRLRARGVPAAVASLEEADRAIIEPVERFFARWMAFSDPPAQTRVRRLVAPHLARTAFTEHLASLPELVTSLSTRTAGDLVRDVALPLSRATTRALLDVSDAHLSALETSSEALIDYLATPGEDVSAGRRALTAIEALRGLVVDLASAGNSMSIDLLKAVDSGRIHADDACAALAQLLTGALEPLTTAFAASAASSSSDEMQSSPAEVVERALRDFPAFHFAPRVATQDFLLEGRRISSGDRVVVNLLAANSEITSLAGEGHLSFGHATHFCLGAGLARAHLRACLPALGASGIAERIDRPSVRRRDRFGQTGFIAIPFRAA